MIHCNSQYLFLNGRSQSIDYSSHPSPIGRYQHYITAVSVHPFLDRWQWRRRFSERPAAAGGATEVDQRVDERLGGVCQERQVVRRRLHQCRDVVTGGVVTAPHHPAVRARVGQQHGRDRHRRLRAVHRVTGHVPAQRSESGRQGRSQGEGHGAMTPS